MLSDFIPQPTYNMILKNVPIACVDIAIVNEGKILLVKREDPPVQEQWWVPGGRVLKGEKMHETAARKCIEEVGLECHVGPIVHTAETIFNDGPYGISTHSINSCFLAYLKFPGQKVHLDNHHEKYLWVDNIPPYVHYYVRDCLKGAGIRE